MTTSLDGGVGHGDPRSRAWWPADTRSPLRTESLGQALLDVADAVGDRAAIVEAGTGTSRTTTYRELADRAVAAARGLLADGAVGDAVAIWSPNSTEWVVAEYAVALAGMVLVPLNPAFTDTEARLLVERSRVTVILATRTFRGRDLVTEAGGLAQVVPEVRRVHELARIDEIGGDGPTLPDVDPHRLFLVQYTSGTTGEPKGAMLSQHAALNVGVFTPPLLDLDDGPVWVNPLPMHHVGASVCVLLSVLAARGTVVLSSDYAPERVLDVLESTRATVLGAVPTMLFALLDHLDHPGLGARDLSALQIVQIGGSTVPSPLIERAEHVLGARIVNAYGQSEAPSACQTRLADPDTVKALTIGRAGLHREARISHPLNGTTLPVDEPGELCIRTPLAMSGYLDDPERTAETIDANGWVRTGDLCSMAANGVITMHGRLREVVIRGGENVYPAEVEAVLLRHPAVAGAAVLGAPDDYWGEQVAAFVRFRPGGDVDWAVLETHVRGYIAGFKVPRVWRAVEEFPLTAAGKVQKFRLREQLT